MVSRREFLERGTMAALAGSVTGVMPGGLNARSASAPPPPVDYYDKLGVAKIINAAGTYTYLTASTMPPEVQAAVAVAARYPVRLSELQRGAGDYLAKRLQCEAAMVTCGAASALKTF